MLSLSLSLVVQRSGANGSGCYLGKGSKKSMGLEAKKDSCKRENTVAITYESPIFSRELMAMQVYRVEDQRSPKGISSGDRFAVQLAYM